jgi:hypothetical protein
MRFKQLFWTSHWWYGAALILLGVSTIFKAEYPFSDHGAAVVFLLYIGIGRLDTFALSIFNLHLSFQIDQV